MKIAVFGLGYVGTTAVACHTKEGHSVIGVDASEEKVATMNSGRSPIIEPGLDRLLEEAVAKRLLMCTMDAAPHLSSCAMAIVCVGTPSAHDGGHNMTYIANVSHQIASLLDLDRDRREPLTVVYRSTMRPGSMDELVSPIFEQVLGTRTRLAELVYNPEFLRESVAITDYLDPARIVVGTKDGGHCKTLDELNTGLTAPTYYTGYREAEMTKFVDNAFHALKVAYANEIGRICYRLQIDAMKVHEIFIADTKLNISPYYLRPGGAFGGSCLPKDVRALQHIASDLGVASDVINSLLRSNEAHKNFLFEACCQGLNSGAKVLMIGLSFKANSDDLRESPNIDMARKFLQAGHRLSIYDPQVDPTKLLGQNLGYAYSTLPELRKLLIAKEEMESTQYELIVDTRGWASKLGLKQARVFDMNSLY